MPMVKVKLTDLVLGLKRVNVLYNIGLNVYIDATIFITLNETKLHDLYHEFGDTWYAYIVRSSYSAIKSTTV